MNKCPKCGQATISNTKKFMLGPGRTIECPNCYTSLSISWWTMLLMLIVLTVIFTIDDLVSFQLYVLISLGMIALYLFVLKYFVPLTIRKD